MSKPAKSTFQILTEEHWDNIRAHFLGLKDYGPQLTCIGAAIVYVVAWMLGAPEWLTSVTLAFVAGGMFGWFSKSLTFRKVLRDELALHVYSPQHLKTRKDVRELWRIVTEAAGLPAPASGHAYSVLTDHLWDGSRPYHFSSLTRIHELHWEDAEAGVVKITTTHDGTVVNADPSQPITYTASLKGRRSRKFVAEPKLISCVIAHPTIAPRQTICADFERIDGEDAPTYRINARTPAAGQYQLNLSWTYAQDIDDDNMILWESQVVVEHLYLKVLYDPTLMTVLVRELGKNEYDPLPTTDQMPIHRQSADLLIPWNGYILTIQRKSPTEGEGSER